MKTIQFEDLYFPYGNNGSKGSYGTVKECIYQGKTFAHKSFCNAKYLKGKKLKLNEISKIDNPYLYVPLYWVKKENYTNQYLSKFCFGKDIDALSDYEIAHKIKILKSGKNAVTNMHDNGIIHTDLIGTNIMIENDKARIIDFDNATFDKFKTNPSQSNDLSYKFIEKYGIIPEVDIYIFNLLTFSIINDCDLYKVRANIEMKQYGYIDSNDAIDICKHMSFDNTVPINDFLIDAIDETKFKI